MSKEPTYELSIVSWQGELRAVYLNNHRIAGSKPWGGGTEVASFKVTASEIHRALPSGTLVPVRLLNIILRDMRASGSWDAATLDRVIENINPPPPVRRCARCGDEIAFDDEIDGCCDPDCPEQEPA